jgi:hypothetical protein
LLDFNPKREEGTEHLGHGTEKVAIFWNQPHQSKTKLSFSQAQRVV